MPLTAQLDVADMRCLIVEDLAIHAEHLRTALTMLGFVWIDHATGMGEALEKMEAAAYDIIFVDWNMHGRSGYYLLQTCRAKKNFDRVAFVMVSSESGKDSVADALKAGANAYIIKPVQMASLTEQMNKVIAWIEQG